MHSTSVLGLSASATLEVLLCLACAKPSATLVTLDEATQLISSLSEVAEVLRSGQPAGIAMDPPVVSDKCPFYLFRVWHDAGPETASTLVGWYVVNKHTADVWMSVPEEFLTRSEIVTLQHQVRHRHHIDDSVIAAFRDLSWWGEECVKGASN